MLFWEFRVKKKKVEARSRLRSRAMEEVEEAKTKKSTSLLLLLLLLTLAARYAFLCARPAAEIHSPLPRNSAARASTPRSRASAVVALAAGGGPAMSVCFRWLDVIVFFRSG